MSFRDDLKARAAELVKRETVHLPDMDRDIIVRGLMAGEVRRAGEHERSTDAQIALTTEDLSTGKQIWNPNDLLDLNEIAECLTALDTATIVEASNRLSGLGKLQALYQKSASSSSPSPALSAEASTS